MNKASSAIVGIAAFCLVGTAPSVGVAQPAAAPVPPVVAAGASTFRFSALGDALRSRTMVYAQQKVSYTSPPVPVTQDRYTYDRAIRDYIRTELATAAETNPGSQPSIGVDIVPLPIPPTEIVLPFPAGATCPSAFGCVLDGRSIPLGGSLPPNPQSIIVNVPRTLVPVIQTALATRDIPPPLARALREAGFNLPPR